MRADRRGRRHEVGSLLAKISDGSVPIGRMESGAISARLADQALTASARRGIVMLRIMLVLATLFGFAPTALASVVTANVNCRAAASVKSSPLERISAGTPVTVRSRAGAWSRVDRRRSCWILSRYIGEQGGVSASSYPPRGYVSTGYSSRSYTRSIGTKAETRRANRRSMRSLTRSHRSYRSARSYRSRRFGPSYFGGGACPCSGSNVCIGPRGGRYCITSGGNKRYGV